MTEIFADGLSGVRIVGETVRLDFVSLSRGDGTAFDHRVRIVLPTANLAAVVDLMTKAQLTLGQHHAARSGPEGAAR